VTATQILSSAVTRLRAEWAERFIDTCAIARTGDRGTYNPTTLQYDGGSTPAVYSGPALVRPGSGGTTEFGQALQTHHEYEVYLPHTATGIEPEDEVTVAVAADADLDGKVLVVEAVYADAYITRRMVGCRLPQSQGNP
jgi:hypothetical protein